MSEIEKLKEAAREKFLKHRAGMDLSRVAQLNDLDEIVTSTYLQAVEDCAKIVQVHEEGEELSYCDTGADMEMGCRSECVHMALDRLRKHYKSLKQNKDND